MFCHIIGAGGTSLNAKTKPKCTHYFEMECFRLKNAENHESCLVKIGSSSPNMTLPILLKLSAEQERWLVPGLCGYCICVTRDLTDIKPGDFMKHEEHQHADKNTNRGHL